MNKKEAVIDENPEVTTTSLAECVKSFAVVLATLIMLVAFSAVLYAGEPLRIVNATVERVSDGDTLVAFDENGTKLRVRLAYIDAPETAKYRNCRQSKPGQPYGTASKNALEDKVKGKTVELWVIDIDQYKRLVSEVYIGNRNINVEMVREGMAEVYREYLTPSTREFYLEAERYAIRRKLGIWSQATYERPSDFRRRTRTSGG